MKLVHFRRGKMKINWLTIHCKIGWYIILFYILFFYSALKEIGMSLKASHAKVVKVYGIVDINSSIGIVMEYLKYGNLKHVTEVINKDMTPCILTEMMRNIADGLTYLHNLHKDERIVHGDIKPQNILVGDHLVCKISDFGGSVLREHTGQTPENGKNDAMDVTKTYCAPEYLSNPHQKARTSMDVYSFGSVIKSSNINKIEELTKISEEACNTDPSKRPSMIQLRKRFGENDSSLFYSEIPSIVKKLEKKMIVDLNSVSDGNKLCLKNCSDQDFGSLNKGIFIENKYHLKAFEYEKSYETFIVKIEIYSKIRQFFI